MGRHLDTLSLNGNIEGNGSRSRLSENDRTGYSGGHPNCRQLPVTPRGDKGHYSTKAVRCAESIVRRSKWLKQLVIKEVAPARLRLVGWPPLRGGVCGSQQLVNLASISLLLLSIHPKTY